MDYRAAAPADEPFLREMLWLAYNSRDQTVAADHWPDPDGPRATATWPPAAAAAT